jgi:hypothetical protein
MSPPNGGVVAVEFVPMARVQTKGSRDLLFCIVTTRGEWQSPH